MHQSRGRLLMLHSMPLCKPLPLPQPQTTEAFSVLNSKILPTSVAASAPSGSESQSVANWPWTRTPQNMFNCHCHLLPSALLPGLMAKWHFHRVQICPHFSSKPTRAMTMTALACKDSSVAIATSSQSSLKKGVSRL